MKRFDYWCKACKFKFEELVTEDTTVECPKCFTANVMKLISTPIFHMNGISDSKLREEFSEDFN
jgi:putative FmdB family regulatory protein|tara:strand:+ start:318 stop:509 length:192 start_codon:yes stop_codon:yes gene_type:complete